MALEIKTIPVLVDEEAEFFLQSIKKSANRKIDFSKEVLKTAEILKKSNK